MASAASPGGCFSDTSSGDLSFDLHSTLVWCHPQTCHRLVQHYGCLGPCFSGGVFVGLSRRLSFSPMSCIAYMEACSNLEPLKGSPDLDKIPLGANHPCLGATGTVLTECVPALHKTLSNHHNLRIRGVEAGRPRVQSHSQLYSECGSIMCYPVSTSKTQNCVCTEHVQTSPLSLSRLSTV